MLLTYVTRLFTLPLYVVNTVYSLTNTIMEISLLSKSLFKIHFKPGQYFYLHIHAKNLDIPHPFMIASPPGLDKAVILVESKDDYTYQLRTLKPDTKVYLEGPYGSFSYLNSRNTRQVWVGEGIGIAPFVSMAQSLRNPKYNICLFYTAPDSISMAYLSELVLVEARFPHLKVNPYQTANYGALKVTAILKSCLSFTNTDIFISADPQTIVRLLNEFKMYGVKRKNIHIQDLLFS